MIVHRKKCDSPKGQNGQAAVIHDVDSFTLQMASSSTIPVLIAAPHGGRAYTPALLKSLRHGDEVLRRLEDRYVDKLAQAIAQATGAGLLIAHAPRALIDLNRAPNDIDWEMLARDARPVGGRPLPSRRVRNGLGLVPRRLAGAGELLRGRLEGDELTARISNVHEPYHHALANALDALRAQWGAVLLIDLHSMPPLVPSRDMVSAQVVLGDRFGVSCSAAVVAEAFAHFAQCGREAAHNRPYAGGYVLERHGSVQKGVHAIQLEIDRSRYLEPGFVELSADAAGVISDLTALVRRLAPMIVELGRTASEQNWPVAAE